MSKSLKLGPKRSKGRAVSVSGMLFLATAPILLLSACGGSDSSSSPATVAATCDNSLTSLKLGAGTSITLARQFKAGDDLNLNGTPSGTTAANDVCMVKLLVGPGNPGPASAPSTSSGIHIEVWLPTKANWGGRIHVLGGGGFDGSSAIGALDQIGSTQAASIAATEGAVSAVADGGHVAANPGVGDWAMNPDGSVNTTLWTDFASRALHQMALQSRALTNAFYLQQPKHAYFDGCSNGGREANSEAQNNPDDYDGILAGSAAMNWAKFSTNAMYPQVVMQRDLGGVPLTSQQLGIVSSAAVSACDGTLTGRHDGFISDPASCRYDPTQDKTVLCTSSGGTNATSACVTTVQAQAINKMWYGQTADGSVPSPALDNGFNEQLSANQLWFGVTRGTQLDTSPFGTGLASSAAGVPLPQGIDLDQLALNLQNPRISSPSFINATGNGTNGWLSLTYQDLANASAQGDALQAAFGHVDTNNTDLSGFKARNGKLLAYHGLADQLITTQGTTNYYVNVVNRIGGLAATQAFYKYYEVPGMGHCGGIGTVNGVTGVSPAANPPLPATNQLYNVLTAWVEQGNAPDTIVVKNSDASISRPLCAYPSKLKYNGGDTGSAASYSCASS